MTSQEKTKSKKKSSPKKVKVTLDRYLSETNQEINIRASNIITKITPEFDINVLSIDNDIRPFLVVLSSDLLNNDKELAYNNAAIMKTIILGLKATQENISIPSSLPVPDMFTLIASLGPGITSLAGITSSTIECTLKNLTRGDESNIFQYGLCLHIGSAGNINNGLMYDIGILIGNIQTNKYPDDNYTKLKELLKKLPDNKYKKLFYEYTEHIYNETKGIISTKTNITQQIPKPLPDTIENKPRLRSRKKKPVVIVKDIDSKNIESVKEPEQKEKEPEPIKEIKQQKESEPENSIKKIVDMVEDIPEQPIHFSTNDDE